MSTPQCTRAFCSPVGLKQTAERTLHPRRPAPRCWSNRYSCCQTVFGAHVQSSGATASDSGYTTYTKTHATQRSAPPQLPHPRIPTPHEYIFTCSESHYVFRIRRFPCNSSRPIRWNIHTTLTWPPRSPPHRTAPARTTSHRPHHPISRNNSAQH